MDKMQALDSFWSGFGIPAIDEQSAYDTRDIDYPYLTYEAASGELDEPIALSADLYYKSTSWTGIEMMAQHIVDTIGYGGVKVNYDNGQIWIKRGTPSYQRLGAENVFDIRRIHININAEFLSV